MKGRASWREVSSGWLALLATLVLALVAPGARAQMCGERWIAMGSGVTGGSAGGFAYALAAMPN